MRPKINLFVLFFVYYYFTRSSCDEERDWLTDEEITLMFGPVDTPVPNDDTKRDIGYSWVVPVELQNGTIITLNLTLTEGILIDNETPIWNVRRRNRSIKSIKYTLNNKTMSRIGDFDLYQDYANKAAVAVFHKDPYYIEGWVGFHHFTEVPYFPSKQQSSPYVQSAGLSSGMQSEWDGLYNETDTRTPPDVVYPEILIHLDRAEVSEDQEAAVRRMIGYWNAVDMLYSKLKNPQIKINIAGIIIPKNYYTMPWITANKYLDQGDETCVYALNAINNLGMYFSTLRHQFPDDSYDFIFSFTSDQLCTASHYLIGLAKLNVSCRHREKRVAVIGHGHTYDASAHELGHLLSIDHDNSDSECKNNSKIMEAGGATNVEQFEWSKCSEKNFTDYFRGSRTKCFDNCPSTMINCEKPPIRRCAIESWDVCELSGYDLNWQQEMDCVKDLECFDKFDSSRLVLVPILNGTIVIRDPSNPPTRVCRNGEAVQYEWTEPICRRLNSV